MMINNMLMILIIILALSDQLINTYPLLYTKLQQWDGLSC
jgi:hypothetical protein